MAGCDANAVVLVAEAVAAERERLLLQGMVPFEAVAAERARIRAAVEGLSTHVVSGYEWECVNCNWSDAAKDDVDDNGVVCIHGEPGDVPIGRAAVLALLDPQP
jgi:hypothetical protein